MKKNNINPANWNKYLRWALIISAAIITIIAIVYVVGHNKAKREQKELVTNTQFNNFVDSVKKAAVDSASRQRYIDSIQNDNIIWLHEADQVLEGSLFKIDGDIRNLKKKINEDDHRINNLGSTELQREYSNFRWP